MGWGFMWLLLSVAVGVLASNRGRSGFGWFVLSVFVSPLVGFVFCIAVKNLQSASLIAAYTPHSGTHLKCPKCAEFVMPEASICKHCGSALTPDPTHFYRQQQTRKAQHAANSQQAMVIVAMIVGLVAIVVAVLRG